MFLLVLSGCGYKANPYYQEAAPESDENVEFIIKKQDLNSENGE